MKKISEMESMLKSKRNKGVDRHILIVKQYFQVEINKLSRRLYELSTSIMKEQRMKSDLHKRLNKAIGERNNFSIKIKDLEDVFIQNQVV